MVDETTGRKEIVKLTEKAHSTCRSMPRRMACKTFQWGGCMIRSITGGEIDTAHDFNKCGLRMHWRGLRRRDVLEALLESIRVALNSTEIELFLHGLWELTSY